MKKRKLHKKNLILLICGCTGLLIFFLGMLYFMMNTNKVTFYIDGKEMDECKVTINYGDEFSFLPADLKLTAKDSSDADITSQIHYEPIALEELKEYEVPYVITLKEKDYIFHFIIRVEDLTGPVFQGPESIDWELGKEFSQTPVELGIRAEDAFDGDVSDQIKAEGTVDVHTEGTYEIKYTVSDQAKNTSEWVVNVHVKEAVQQVNAEENMYQDPRTITPEIIDPNSITVMVNKYHAIPDGWEPNDLVPITSNCGRDMYLRSEAASAWEELNQAAQARGIQILVVSSFRTASYQASLFNNYYAVDGANAFLYSALPRRSEHELGLAIDVSNDGQLHEDLLNTAVGQFMNDEGYKYGFILRYPQDKEAITGYGFEAWHYRYVGKALASELKSRNIVLEEY